jgi:hypothetical protein
MSLAPVPPEPYGLQRFVRQKNAGNITQAKTYRHNEGAALNTNTNLHVIDSSHSHDISSAERDTSQEDPGPDPVFTDERESTKSNISRLTKEATVSTIS